MKKNLIHHLIWALVAVTAFVVGSQLTKPDESKTASPSKSASPRLSDRQSENPDSSPGEKKARTKSSRTSSTSDQPTILSDADIAELGEEFRAAKGPIARRLAFSEMLKNLTPENARLMRENIAHLSQDSAEFREFHYAWGAIAGEEAVLNGAETRERDMASTLAGWAAKSPEDALAYFNSLDKDAQNYGGLKWGAVYGLVDADPNLAVRFAMDQKEAGDKEAGRLMDLVTRQVLRSGDPAEAASWATTIPAGELQDAAISRVAREYADEDPVASLDWANTLPDGKGKNRAVRESFSEWAQENPEAAGKRLSTMTDSPERDSAAYGYATRVAWENPEAGIEWANTISDEGTRSNALMETGRAYFRKDPEAAKQWLSNSGLNEEQQKRVTERSRGRRG